MSEQEQHAERREALTQVAPQSIARAHEVHDVNLRAIALFALALLVVIFIVIFSLRWLVGAWGGENLTPRPQIPPALVTAPRRLVLVSKPCPRPNGARGGAGRDAAA
ncbi:MAG: hypothetical protein R2867_11420 [Caldilineaceae bacterium]